MSEVTKDGIGAIIKERIDNFELNPDNDTKVSFEEQQIPTFNNGIDVIVNDIMTEAEKDRMYFICTSCNCVGDTDYMDKNILKSTVQLTSGLVCKECYEGKESDGIRPTEDEMIIASFSDFNFISKFDQTVPEIVVKDDEYPHGVKLGSILSFDDINVKESSTKISEDLKVLMSNIKEGLKGKLGNKVNDNKLNRMVEQPNKTMLIIELSEIKRKLKLAKKSNHKEDTKYFQNIYNKTKNQLDITHD